MANEMMRIFFPLRQLPEQRQLFRLARAGTESWHAVKYVETSKKRGSGVKMWYNKLGD